MRMVRSTDRTSILGENSTECSPWIPTSRQACVPPGVRNGKAAQTLLFSGRLRGLRLPPPFGRKAQQNAYSLVELRRSLRLPPGRSGRPKIRHKRLAPSLPGPVASLRASARLALDESLWRPIARKISPNRRRPIVLKIEPVPAAIRLRSWGSGRSFDV